MSFSKPIKFQSQNESFICESLVLNQKKNLEISKIEFYMSDIES
jgi:hypothetical protein